MLSLLRRLIRENILHEVEKYENDLSALFGKRKSWKQRETEEDFPNKKNTIPPADAHRRIVNYLRTMRPTEKQKKLIPGIERALELGQNSETDYKNFLSPIADHIWSSYKRVQIRRLWQDAVYSNRERSEFWRDPRNVSCIHGINLFGTPGSELDIFEQMLVSPPVELSCVGTLEPYIPGNKIAIEFLKREVVWASKSDSWTQHLSSATEQVRKDFAKLAVLDSVTTKEEFQVFKGSLVKFPSSTYIDSADVLFTEADFLTIAEGFAGELIIRDYSVDPDDIIVYVSTSYGSDLDEIKEGIQKISFQHYNRPVTIIEV